MYVMKWNGMVWYVCMCTRNHRKSPLWVAFIMSLLTPSYFGSKPIFIGSIMFSNSTFNHLLIVFPFKPSFTREFCNKPRLHQGDIINSPCLLLQVASSRRRRSRHSLFDFPPLCQSGIATLQEAGAVEQCGAARSLGHGVITLNILTQGKIGVMWLNNKPSMTRNGLYWFIQPWNMVTWGRFMALFYPHYSQSNNNLLIVIGVDCW